MSGLGFGQLAAHGFARLSGSQRTAGATGVVAALPDGALIAPDGNPVALSGSGGAAITLAPAYVETLSTGLLSSTPANVSAALEVAVSGAKGSTTLTTTDTTKVAGFGSATVRFEAALISTDSAQMFFASVVGNNGSTQITLREPLENDFAGVLSPKYDAALGQHLSQNGTKAYANHVASQTGLMCSRGGTIDGNWLDGPSSLQTAFTRNAALIAYGVVNSAAPIVQTSFSSLLALNIEGDSSIRGPLSISGRGSAVGTHAAGHGVDGAFNGRGKDVVLEFWTSAFRAGVVLDGTRILVTVTANGVELYRKTCGAYASMHRVPIATAGAISVSITNVDGGIYSIAVQQCTLREAGVSGKLVDAGSKVVTLGDSWFEFYGGLFASTLASITGATVINRALGGQTTEWALAWFDTYVAAEKPDVCILHFFTNDANGLSAQTFTLPDGGTVAKWPSGLTEAQSQVRWRDNINKLISRCQSLGIRPVIINAGGTASSSQAQKHANWSWVLDKACPSQWVATPAQLADSGSYINNFGKFRGATVSIGGAVKYAAGALPADSWSNPAESALSAMQLLVLSASDYDTAPSFALGVDDNTDGVSNGLSAVAYGTHSTSGETLALSIVAGAQRLSYTFVAGNTGNIRWKFNFAQTAGNEYLVVFDAVNGSASVAMDAVEYMRFGSAQLLTGLDNSMTLTAGGSGPLYVRLTAGATVTDRGVAFGPARLNGTTRSVDIKRAYCIDLAALFAAAPNAANFSTAELAAWVLALKP